MDDSTLLHHYLSLRDREAGKWNLSPASLYVELETRDYVNSSLDKRPGIRVLNIGIGTGDWDDFLGFWLDGAGTLMSVDIDERICNLYQYRQSREGHPNPAHVVCSDILSYTPEEQFDLVTIIGSTMKEIGDYESTLAQCSALLKPMGQLLYMDFCSYHPHQQFNESGLRFGLVTDDLRQYTRYERQSFYIMKALKQIG
ncbi:class I SAM-dependent methyltransferase [Paenibacillus sp. H1-7]|uniref:class I SAM-dependent methyltransferase n=1 Tax=Paenibacillus sp. H1-7 TaxID=2282849 RepID=UPI001EF7A274|nr:class I SAM-dependent methyltransferase [Paenibacillus sp. H1-7]ULL17774.1 class I SAM-dependent methyltransferase [Paenibacillus sp. H1-7]